MSEKNYFVHESSYIDEPSTIGEGTKIWHFSHILKGVTVGRKCNIGQNVAVTRVGESFLIRFGLNFDASRDNLGVSFMLEPRFLSSSRLGRVGGVQIPPAGAMGLE